MSINHKCKLLAQKKTQRQIVIKLPVNEVSEYFISIVSIYIMVQKRKVLAIVMRDIYNNLPQNIIIEFGV